MPIKNDRQLHTPLENSTILTKLKPKYTCSKAFAIILYNMHGLYLEKHNTLFKNRALKLNIY